MNSANLTNRAWLARLTVLKADGGTRNIPIIDISDGNHRIATVIHNEFISVEQAKANAVLMSIAPELLGIMSELVRQEDNLRERSVGKMETTLYLRACKAIARAEGRFPETR